MMRVWKEKDIEKRESLKATVDADENTIALRKFYNEKIFPQIKQWCPNLIETLSYKEWDDATKARVQKWIDVVLAGNDPRTVEEAPTVASTVGTESKAETPTPPVENPMFETEDTSTDDLPF